ncbi:c-type cytochrome [Shewanella sp. YLB-07]|nr:c-type cytochrome [Shewanella sp. YLB-07]
MHMDLPISHDGLIQFIPHNSGHKMRNIKQTNSGLRLLFFMLMITSSQFTSAASNENIDSLITQCESCHGTNGVSMVATQPNLAGQKKGYLAKQIRAFRDGNRKNSMMNKIVEGLSEQQMESLADHFSKQVNSTAAKKVQNIAGKHVRARCISCHGMKGFTVNSLWPNLAGQHSDYLQKQLLDFKSGDRQSPTMQVIANELNTDQIHAVAEYFSQQKASLH